MNMFGLACSGNRPACYGGLRPSGAANRIAHAGVEPVPLPVDDECLRVNMLARSDARAVLVPPAHQFPWGVVLAPNRRAELLAWARERDAVIVEEL